MSQKTLWTIGIDEAGRGPIAGPVAVGVVAVRGDLPVSLLLNKDSKQLSPSARGVWFNRIKQASQEGQLFFACALISPTNIDKQGITKSIKLGITKALGKIEHDPTLTRVLLDGGLRAPDEYEDQQTIIRGDATISIVSLASVVAKVTRDRYMEKIARQYPEYNFAKHKGYGTKEHYLLIKQYGLSTIHRKSFCG